MTPEARLRWDHGLAIGLIVGLLGGILGAQWWAGRHASPPAPAGWVLAVPPSGLRWGAEFVPLSIWHRERAFDSAESCEAHRRQLRTESMQALDEALRRGDLGADAVTEAVANGVQREGPTVMLRALDAWGSRCVTTMELKRGRG